MRVSAGNTIIVRFACMVADDTSPPCVSPAFPSAPSLLGGSELAVLAALADQAGRVISRPELARRAGLRDLSERRVDSIIVVIRRALGAESIRTIRRRGWMLETDSVAAASELLAS